MPTQYMDLTNRLLRRLNEVQTTQSNFASVAGIQATAKDAILDTVREINSGRVDWPFNAQETSQVLTPGTQEYLWPSNFTAADFDSFYLVKNATFNINTTPLAPMAREEWYHNYRQADYDANFQTPIGLSPPIYVFPAHTHGFGVSPNPNQAYTVTYRYFAYPGDLVNYNDQVTIPTKWDYVIIAGALRIMYLFKENAEAAAAAEKTYTAGLGEMINIFLPNPDHAYGTQINYGGGQTGSGFLFWKGGI